MHGISGYRCYEFTQIPISLFDCGSSGPTLTLSFMLLFLQMTKEKSGSRAYKCIVPKVVIM